MLKFDILTIFPEVFENTLNFSILKRAQEKNKVRFNVINVRSFAKDKHRTVDDTPFGGGEGMVMKIEPIYNALNSIDNYKNAKKIILSASGKKLTQEKLYNYSKEEHIILICGRYEGVDERILNFIDEEISIGDYVISGGEFASLIIIEGVVRLLPDVLGNTESIKNESFISGLLDYPSYTRPREFLGYAVPEVLLSGDHEKINKWRKLESLKKTYLNRPELLKNITLTKEEREFLDKLKNKKGER